MQKIPVIAIFDVGKTNKKLFLFDEHYRIVYERTAKFTETVDEDGDPCENLESLRLSVFDSLRAVFKRPEFEIKAINFSTYGASFVYVDEDGKPLTPLYNYLKPYPEELQKQFYATYGGEENFSKETASPVLGSLNSGMQLYRIKQEQPVVFQQMKYALHLPQYLSSLISGEFYSDITSIGCHTNLWDFTKGDYHAWVDQEGIREKLAPLKGADEVLSACFPGNTYKVGIGLHDSSAALIPYLVNFQEPFALISTGTWCITLNPFNTAPLTAEELKQDCLSYLQYKGKPVKASRFFGGYEHEQEVKRIAIHFDMSTALFKTLEYHPEIIQKLQRNQRTPEVNQEKGNALPTSGFAERDLAAFSNGVEAYHQFMLDLVAQQVASSQLVLQDTGVKRIFVDGGFGKNAIYMNLLAGHFPEKEVYAASLAQATAIGTALAIHPQWNTKPFPNDLIELKYYAVTHQEA
ncbi:FGGY-family carbohydrate kinase [Rufibacter glacialis]|uniref:Carbohydrate kinase n=1 Tax=Rufibacter glacialis TaxID=1259555 RepID=A0A5M8QB62_9BACT|nr:FGGY family carbohydrate kinase [Rufibacter glacialis]KAA6432343.1 carbohydrate kinase [Rufibacter glacialis]GGK77896.1 carbohydrate kinase [Rufibacter glacialis]